MSYAVILNLLFLVYFLYTIFITIKLYKYASKYGISFYKTSFDTSFYKNNRESLKKSRNVASYFLPLDIYRLLLLMSFSVFFRESFYNIDFDFTYFIVLLMFLIFIFLISYKVYILEMRILNDYSNHNKYASFLGVYDKFDFFMKSTFDIGKNQFVIIKNFFSKYLFFFYFFIIFFLINLLSNYLLLDQHITFTLSCIYFCFLDIICFLFVFFLKLIGYLIKFSYRISFDEKNLYINDKVIDNNDIDSIEIYDIIDFYGNRVRYMRINFYDYSYIFYIDIIINYKISFNEFTNFVLSFEKKYSHRVKFFSDSNNY